jgi:hypothetical protein
MFLGAGECGEQKAHAKDGCHGPVLAPKKQLRAILGGTGNLLQDDRAGVCAQNLTRKVKRNKKREYAHGQKKLHPIGYSHMSSQDMV